ncbi:MAG: hypothetical protein IJK18_04800 [Clostridia bacterium]|nr:hypothetical protein [Clostridia bacterium]
MGDSAMAVVAIFMAAILMFVFPLMTMADRKDDVVTLEIQTETENYVKEIATTGKTTQNAYDNYIQTLAATGNAYDVDITVQVLDENPAKKETSATKTIGENVYLTLHTTQVLEQIQSNNFRLKEGDIITITVKNKNETIGMQLRNFLYRVTGNNSATITASVTKMVTTNGQ